MRELSVIMLSCAECNRKAGKHHIVPKGSDSIIVYLPINEVPLCSDCHKKIHNNKDMDYKYKALLQSKLNDLLPGVYYSLDGCKAALHLNRMQTKILANHVVKNDNGYCSVDIIKYLMSGKLYFN